MELFFDVASALIMGFYIALQTCYFFLLVASVYGIWKQPHRVRLQVPELMLESVATPPVTILVPAHNEEATVVESVHALLALRYPGLEVVVINDGSTDGTLAELTRSFSLRAADLVFHRSLSTQQVRGVYLSTLYPQLLIIDKDPGGKSDALNAGINVCRTPWVCSVDADSILEEDALMRIMRPVLEDNTVVGSSGIVRIANGCRVAGGRVIRVGLPREKLAVFQVVEYLHAFLQGRLGWSWLNALLIISGAFGVFRTDVLRAIGGYGRDTVAEDMDVVVRIHSHFRRRREPYRVVFVPDPVCWTEVPSRMTGLRRQRRRWHRGLAEVLEQHRGLFFHPPMGILGFVALPVFALELVAPVVEVAGYIIVPLAWWFRYWSLGTLMLLVVLVFFLATFYSVTAVVLEEVTYRRYDSLKDLFRLFRFALVEHIGYHQLVVWWRLEGLYDYWRGYREWGRQTRLGFRSGRRVHT